MLFAASASMNIYLGMENVNLQNDLSDCQSQINTSTTTTTSELISNNTDGSTPPTLPGPPGPTLPDYLHFDVEEESTILN